MNFFIAVTDNDWFSFLAERRPDEVNFWRPSGRGFGSIPVGAPFLFKLHSPLNFIAGGGFFVRSEKLPLSLAWDAFEEKNGAASLGELRRLIMRRRGGDERDPEIGCVILNEPFFLPREKWIPAPRNWSPNIVAGKTYNTDEPVGRHLWDRVVQLMLELPSGVGASETWREGPRFGAEYLARSRLGQGAFRLLVTDAYGRRCAITGEKSLPALEAAHIKPFSEKGPTTLDNGMLIRADLHNLFDAGYITVTPDYHVEVSRCLKDDFDNGRDYYPLDGKQLVVLPRHAAERPSREFLSWHNESRYRG